LCNLFKITATSASNVIFSVIALSIALLAASVPVFQPLFSQEQIRLETVSDKGTFKIDIIWISNKIGSSNTFEIHFVEPETGIEIEDIKYDILIYRDDRPEIQRLDQTSIFQELIFEEAGAFEIRIDNIEDLGEGATIPIEVTPEFQLELSMFCALALAIAFLAAKITSNHLFRHTFN
jgi:hypothetical protein